MAPFKKGESGNPKGAAKKLEHRQRLVTTVAGETLDALKRRAVVQSQRGIGSVIDELVARAERSEKP